MNTLTIAVTGAGGYVGSRLCRFLRSRGHRVTAMGRGAPAAADRLIPFTLGGANDYAPLAGIDALIHCAYDFTLRDPAAIRRVNGEGSAELMREARARGVGRIIYISSTSAFAGAVSDYGRVKYETEQRAHEIGAVVTRPGLVFSRNAGGIVGSLEKLVVKLPAIPLVGRGDQEFYPCHVTDLSALLSYLAEREVKESAPVTAASEETVTFKQIILRLAELHERRVITVPVPYAAMWAGLKLAETLHLPLGMRSDSLNYMKQGCPKPDFRFIKEAGMVFRPFTAEALGTG